MIELRNVHKTYKAGSGKILTDFHLHIQDKEFIGLLGPSGCGKTTLLKLIAGLEMPDSGEVLFSEKDRVGYVFQEANLIPWLSVQENALLHFKIKARAPDFKALDQWLHRLNLIKAKDLYPHELSGGMQMRASILRALMMKPRVLLLDEPFAALDEVIRVDLQKQLFDLSREESLTVIFVTHSISEATKLCHRIVLLNYGGKVVLDQTQNLKQFQFNLDSSQQNLATKILEHFPQVRGQNL